MTKKVDALAEERTEAVESAKLLEEAALDRMELTRQHYEETERAKIALNNVLTTYQTQLLEYGVQAQATIALIKKLKEEKQAVEDKSKMKAQCNDGQIGHNWRLNYRLCEWMWRTRGWTMTTSVRWMQRVLYPSGKSCRTIFCPWQKNNWRR